MIKSFVIRLFLLILPLTLITCDSLLFNIDCTDCTSYEPSDAQVEIELTEKYTSNGVVVTIYRGKIDGGRRVLQDTIFNVKTYFPPVELSTNSYYSVTAEYTIEDVLIAVDGKELKTEYITDLCQENCYIIEGDKFDLRIKE
jgi:hypothetical protein